MWSFASKLIAGTSNPPNPNQDSDFSDDEISINNCQEEGLECPICWESFNVVENVPHVLLCGHTLCNNCVLGLQSAIIKLQSFPIHLPFFISCPWCNLLSFRLFYKGKLRFPRKNYFLVSLVESLNGDRVKSHSCSDHPDPGSTRSVNHHDPGASQTQRLHLSFPKSLIFFVNLTAMFPLGFVFLGIALHAIPASIAILVVYILVAILFAVPSFLVLYLAYPGLDWLLTEMVT